MFIAYNRYGGVVVESSNITGMLKNHKLARAVSDAGWGQFLKILKHKTKVGRCSVREKSVRF